MIGSGRLEQGDCIDVMLEMYARGEQFDALVSDPPYHLTSVVERFGKPGAAHAKHGTDGLYARQSRGFMGKEWDGGDVAFQASTWRLAYDILKPGAHLLAFGGSRTFHRMAVAIEDAGFEIRDCVMWLYGTGFPKSHDVSKGIDKRLGVSGEVVAIGDPVKRMIPGADQDATGSWVKDNGREYQPGAYIPGSPEAAAWQGWGTALKPGYEPIIVARKPLAGTVAANVLAHGTGALNIDVSRIGESGATKRSHQAAYERTEDGKEDRSQHWARTGHKIEALALGRWPANVIHDGSDDVLEAFAEFGERGAAAPVRGTEASDASTGRVTGRRARVPGAFHGDTGSAARFFYSAKATAADRAGSKHPTVKPLALMRYLCRLVTPPGGTVLDPFAGSGTTLAAAMECGFNAVGIERDPEYQADIQRRLDALELASLCA